MYRFDHHNATFVDSTVIKALERYSLHSFGDANAHHRIGESIRTSVTSAQKQIRALVQAEEEWNLMVLPSHAEAIAQVFWSIYMHISRYSGKSQFLIQQNGSDFLLQKIVSGLHEFGGTEKLIQGIDPKTILEQLNLLWTPSTCAVSLHWACKETGVLQPLEAICHWCQERQILLHVDCSYAIGRVPIDLRSLAIDFLTFRGEQIHAPKQSAVLLYKKPLQLTNFISPEYIDVTHTDPTTIIGMGIAAEQAQRNHNHSHLEMARLRMIFERTLEKASLGITPLFTQFPRIPTYSLIAFPGVHGEWLAYNLHRADLFPSICRLQQSVLEKGLSGQFSPLGVEFSTLGFALSHSNTQEEVLKACTIITNTFSRILKCSPT